jgi:hypothetical protein
MNADGIGNQNFIEHSCVQVQENYLMLYVKPICGKQNSVIELQKVLVHTD